VLLVSHPTGNSNVRALLDGTLEAGRLGAFATTLGFAGKPRWFDLIPGPLRDELMRRCYALRPDRLATWPVREAARLSLGRLGLRGPTHHETGWASVDAVYRALDRRVALRLPRWQGRHRLTVAYAYEDGALATLRTAKSLGMTAAYDLPIAYWKTARELLAQEIERYPEWEPTLVGTQDSPAKLERKEAELSAADVVVCPSRFVLDSIPESLRRARRCVVSEFGSPPAAVLVERQWDVKRPLRCLFAGSMSQRKGLADVFAAFRLLGRSDVELVVMGSMLMPSDFYRRHGGDFTYEPTRAHAEVLRLMDRCDVLLLPSLVEGRALVQQEALSRGLPIIVTRNAGGEELVQDGQTGFLVPIRSPAALAEKIAWIADHRDALPHMSLQAHRMASRFTWAGYADKVLSSLGLVPTTAEDPSRGSLRAAHLDLAQL
jgi:glycosyltransferase involved in cell wall biosynthesis